MTPHAGRPPDEPGAGGRGGGPRGESVARPTRPDRVALHSLYLAWDLPPWFQELGAIPTKSELDVWRWAFRAHGSRTLTAAQKDIVWTVATFARATDSDQHPVGTAWPSQERIAEMTAVTVQTVGEALKSAEVYGWLIRRRVPNANSRVYLTIPKVLPDVVDRRSRRSVLTENRTPVVTENQFCPDGEPDPRRDGDEPSIELTEPTSESTSGTQSVADLQGSRPESVKIRFISGASQGSERTVTSDQAATAVRRGIAELVPAVLDPARHTITAAGLDPVAEAMAVIDDDTTTEAVAGGAVR